MISLLNFKYMQYNKNISRFSLFIQIFICLSFSYEVKGQKQYEINVSEKFPELRYDFLKMGTPNNNKGESLTYSSVSLLKNGQPWFPIMGEIHYSRVPEQHWEEELLKMKAGGIEVIATYILWNHIESEEGKFDWTGNNNFRKFLELCKKHNLYVWLRPGPWCHAEVRYGGFPDWLIQKKTGLRKNDPIYLDYTQKFFKEIYKQCDGLLFKQGGPIIATQIENELHFEKNEANYQHCLSLKKILIELGFDVPYYSVFARANTTQNDFLVTLGGYPDSPWSQNTKTYYKPIYFIRPFEMDGDIGADLFGTFDGKIKDRLPKIGAEMGAGMQETYHRRVKVSADDIVGNLFVKLASGLNGIGYYMYHGGENPFGQHGLQESRLTEYPNDMAIVDYDFQAPIGAMGIVHDHYYKLNALHQFIKEYGGGLTQMNPSFTTVIKNDVMSIDTVQVSLRQKNGKGFLFLSNYQRMVDNPTVQNFQLTVNGQYGVEKIPQKPISFPANSFTVWPYHQNIEGNELVYATAQPLCILNNEKEKTYLYFSSVASEFLFSKPIEVLEIDGFTVQGNSIVASNYPAWFSFKSENGTLVRIVVLDSDSAYKSNKIKWGDTEYILIGNGVLLKEDNKLVFETTTPDNLRSFPEIHLESKEIESTETKGLYSYYNLKKHFFKPNFKLKADKALNPFQELQAKKYKDSLLGVFATSSRFNPKQPGPLYGVKFHHIPGEKTYTFSAKLPQNNLIKDWIIDFRYLGDGIALYQKDKLAYDQFNYQNLLQIKSGYFSKSEQINFKIQLVPFDEKFDVYVEKEMKPFLKSWENPKVISIDALPLYKYEFLIKSNNDIK
jgi:beta-galactosidase